MTFEADPASVATEISAVRWEVIGCEPVYDLTQSGEPIIAWNAVMEEIREDHLELLPPYIPNADWNEQILLGGQWVRYDDTAVWDRWFGLGNADTSPCAGMM